MDYQEVLSYLERSWRFGSRLGLERIQELMRRLGDPQKKLRCIHVAGTNGKGSTVTFIATILAESGRKTGVYTSPFIARFTDRIRILDGPETVQARLLDSSAGEISEEAVARIFTEVSRAADQMAAEGLDQPTEFELITAMGFLYFAEQQCDVVVLEVGLGGRLDATNVIDKPEVAVITALGYDHMDRLGHTMREISGEKAGIIKPGTRQVLLYEPEAASRTLEDADQIREVITERCRACEVPLRIVTQAELLPLERTFEGQSFRLQGYARPLHTRLIGSYQNLNAALAIRAVEAFDPDLTDTDVVYRGIRHAMWPARMEVIQQDPLFVIDGAHNPQAAYKLRETMELLAGGRHTVMLTGVLADKEFQPMLYELLRRAAYQVDAIVVTEPKVFRKKKAKDYLEAIRAFYEDLPEYEKPAVMPELILAEGLDEALARGLELASVNNRMLLAWGSLYLASDLKLAYAKMNNKP